MPADAKRVRIAVVGCGGWTQGWHLPNLASRSDVDIVALVDPCEKPGAGGCVPDFCEPMASLCTKYGAKRYSDFDQVLADKELALDGILCAAPQHAHVQVGSAALLAGLHVLMEKPMTADVDEARALLTLARERPEQAFILNNTANWQPGTLAAFEAVRSGKIGTVRHVNCILASPLGWLFEGKEHVEWTTTRGTMVGNGFGWGQFSHTFGWVFKVTGLTPACVYAVSTASEVTGADLYNAVTVTCTNGCTISASGVGTCPDKGFKVVGNWLFGSEGMLSYCGLAGSDNVNCGLGSTADDAASASAKPRNSLEVWRNDGTHEVGPPVEFEHLDQKGTGPGSMDAWVDACRGQPYFAGAGAVEGLKAVATIDAMYRSAKSGQPEAVTGCEGL